MPTREASESRYQALHSARWPRVAMAAGLVVAAIFVLWPVVPSGPRVASSAARMSADERLCMATSKPHDATCLGAPYLYGSFHGGSKAGRIKNVCKFTRDGCPLGAVLRPSAQYTPHSVRGLAATPNGNVLVAEAYRKESRLVEFGPCGADGRRDPLRSLATNVPGNTGLVHPYAVALNGTASRVDDVFVSAQGTFAVYRYDYSTGLPRDVSPAILELTAPAGGVARKRLSRENVTFWRNLLRDTYKSSKLEPAARARIAEFVFPGQFVNLDGADVRGVAVDDFGRLWVANKTKGVQVYDGQGRLVATPLVTQRKTIPVALTHHAGFVYVSCLRNHSVIAVDTATLAPVRSYTCADLRHPSGVVIFDDEMFVFSQLRRMLLSFNLNSGESRAVIEGLVDTPEDLELSEC